MITQAELQTMQSIASQALTDTLDVTRPTTNTDALGGVSTGVTAIATLACRIEDLNGDDILLLNRMSITGNIKGSVPAYSNIQVGDLLLHKSKKYKVTHIFDQVTWEITRDFYAGIS